jgi:hypothetical protein
MMTIEVYTIELQWSLKWADTVEFHYNTPISLIVNDSSIWCYTHSRNIRFFHVNYCAMICPTTNDKLLIRSLTSCNIINSIIDNINYCRNTCCNKQTNTHITNNSLKHISLSNKDPSTNRTVGHNGFIELVIDSRFEAGLLGSFHCVIQTRAFIDRVAEVCEICSNHDSPYYHLELMYTKK